MADNFPWSSSLNTFTDVFSEPSSPNSSRTAQKEPIVHSENLYHAHLGSQNDGNSSIGEPLREIDDNNISPDCSTATAWGRGLKSMPPFGEKQIDNRLIRNSKTMPDLKAPLAYRHKKQGYKLWKEGYVRKVVTKPDILSGVKRLFLVKANVSASMKRQNYLVYCHLDQLSGEVAFSKCNCKSGQVAVNTLLHCCIFCLTTKISNWKKSQMIWLALRCSSSGVFHPTLVRQKRSSLKNWLLRKLITLETKKTKESVHWSKENEKIIVLLHHMQRRY